MKRCLAMVVMFAAVYLPLLAQNKHQGNVTTLAFEQVLPKVFSGWEKQPGSQLLPIAGEADPANADVLKEYGFNGVERARYRVNSREMTVTAMRFDDATGAFGAFTFYRQPSMAPEKFCDEGASDHAHVLFLCGNLVLDVQLDTVTAMTAAEMRSLAEKLPRPRDNAGVPPNLPGFLPDTMKEGLKYVLGPAAYKKIDAPVSPDLIDFERSPEIAVAHFKALDGAAASMVINYPTPHIAMQEESRLQAYAKTRHPANGSLNTFAVKRIGPLVAVVTGEIAPAEASALLERVHYEAFLTQNEATGLEPKNNVGNLLYNIVLLALIISGFALVTGFAFGGARILMRKWYPGKLVDRPEDVEFIRLDLNK